MEIAQGTSKIDVITREKEGRQKQENQNPPYPSKKAKIFENLGGHTLDEKDGCRLKIQGKGWQPLSGLRSLQ